MNTSLQTYSVFSDTTQSVVLKFEDDTYCVSHISLLEHDESRSTHEYMATINGSEGHMVVNCGFNPPVITMCGNTTYEIDHSFQDDVIEHCQAAIAARCRSIGA